MPATPIDWSQLWYPGPKRAFTADEMARAGSDAPSPTMLAMAAINVALVGFLVLQLAPATETARLLGVMLVMLVMLVMVAATGSAARWLWWRPWRQALMVATVASLLLMTALMLGLRWRLPNREDRYWMAALMAGMGALNPVLLWFLVVWRAQHIEARLREQAEREKAIEMARRLAAAQLEPHFLFNTLASVQHWVQTKDDRAAPLLAALTGYLRATMPMFNRPLLAVGDELQAIERYLQVMQARMGARLAWRIDVDVALHTLQLPPGVLLTLTENAVVHGLEPQLGGGELLLRGRALGDTAHFEIIDNGPGPAPGMQEGVGLSNVRQRLLLTCGAAAQLKLGAAPGGGFKADLSMRTSSATTTPPP